MSTTVTTPAIPSTEVKFDPTTATTDQIAAQIAATKQQAQNPPPPPPVASDVLGQDSAAPAVVTPVKEDWGEYTKGADGSYSVKLATGEVFTAANDGELVSKLGKAHVETKRWAQENRTPVVTTPAIEADAARQEVLNKYFATIGENPAEATATALASYLGLNSAAELREFVQKQTANTQQSEGEMVVREFLKGNPDYPNTDAANNTMLEFLKEANLPINPRTLGMAHATLIKEGKYKPLSKEEQQQALLAGLGIQPTAQAKPNNPPMVSGGQPVTSAAKDPSTMTLAEIEAEIKAERARQGLS